VVHAATAVRASTNFFIVKSSVYNSIA
jgi:hypothetical protein